MILKNTVCIALLLAFFTGNAQEQLTRTEAVRIMLENNYGIKVAKYNRQIAENNTSKELNGYLPTVNATAGGNTNLGSSSQKFSNGNEASVENALNWGANASLGANYTLFDKRRDVVLEQLKELVLLSDMELRQTMELNMLQLLSAYYEVARLTENLKVQEETIELSRQRLLRAQYRFDYGQAIRLDVLNAQVDIQRDSINLLSIEQQLANSKRNLNVIMGRPVNTDFVVDTEVTYSQDLSLENLLASVQRNNTAVKITDQNLEITNYDLKVIDAERKPTIGASASYDFSYQNNAAGSFITSSNSRGLAAGVNVSWNIFDGGARKVREETTRVAIASQQILREQLLQELERDVTNAWETYQNALFILEAERNNLVTNELNFERTEELFKSGQLNSVEFRQAQLNLLTASTSFNTAKFNAKSLENQLYQLSGDILDQQF